MNFNKCIQEIDNLHSAWSQMEKSAKLGWLTGEKMRLNRLANQFAQYIQIKGGFLNDNERDYARKLLAMIQEVDCEGSKVANDLVNDAFKDIIKGFLK